MHASRYAGLALGCLLGHSGSAGIWLSGYDDATDSVSQYVVVPAATTRLVVRFY